MAVFRVNKTGNYTIMSNRHFKEKEMSLKAKGLLSLMLSLPSDWNYSLNGLVALCKENETSVKTALNELKQFGYLRITKQKPSEENGGRFRYVYDIYETPQETEIQNVEKQGTEKQGIENLGVEIQWVENHPIYKDTNKSSTNELNTKKLKEKELTEEFNRLWELYPNKKGKTNALKSYLKACKNGSIYEQVKLGIENYKAEIKAKGTPIEYIKHGSTWFNQQCWNDEYETKPQYPQQKEETSFSIELAEEKAQAFLRGEIDICGKRR